MVIYSNLSEKIIALKVKKVDQICRHKHKFTHTHTQTHTEIAIIRK